jgi:hypothetical protein
MQFVKYLLLLLITVDACKVNNGGCDSNAVCLCNKADKSVKCTCKDGYRNTGAMDKVVCTGNFLF